MKNWEGKSVIRDFSVVLREFLEDETLALHTELARGAVTGESVIVEGVLQKRQLRSSTL